MGMDRRNVEEGEEHSRLIQATGSIYSSSVCNEGWVDGMGHTRTIKLEAQYPASVYDLG
jgi:hypothetical protein